LAIACGSTSRPDFPARDGRPRSANAGPARGTPARAPRCRQTFAECVDEAPGAGRAVVLPSVPPRFPFAQGCDWRSIWAACQRLKGSVSARSWKSSSWRRQGRSRAEPGPRSRGTATATGGASDVAEKRSSGSGLGQVDHVMVDLLRRSARNQSRCRRRSARSARKRTGDMQRQLEVSAPVSGVSSWPRVRV